MNTIVEEFHDEVPPQYASVADMLSNVESVDYSKTKDYVILLPHSQGNIYANNLYQYLTQIEHFDKSRISIFGYATPANEELGQMLCNGNVPNYITSMKDMVISLSRNVFGALPANIAISMESSDTSGHGLTENYLRDTNSIDYLNSFINVTSNSCFTDLHEWKRSSVPYPAFNRIIYDKSSNAVIQIATDHMCQMDADVLDKWSCVNKLSSLRDWDANSIIAGENGNIYLTGNGESGLYLVTYSAKNSVFTNIQLISYESMYGYNPFYYNGSIYGLDTNTLEGLELYELIGTIINMFQGLQLDSDTKSAVDSNGNLFVAPLVPGYMSTVQIYYQNINSFGSVPIPIGIKTEDYIVNGLAVINDTLFACGGRDIYYMSTKSNASTQWSFLNNGGCAQLFGDGKYLFATFSNQLYRYSL